MGPDKRVWRTLNFEGRANHEMCWVRLRVKKQTNEQFWFNGKFQEHVTNVKSQQESINRRDEIVVSAVILAQKLPVDVTLRFQ